MPVFKVRNDAKLQDVRTAFLCLHVIGEIMPGGMYMLPENVGPDSLGRLLVIGQFIGDPSVVDHP